MHASARELNQRTAQILTHVEHGETVVITKNGFPIAVMRPHTEGDDPVRPYRTDPMGHDLDAPIISDGPTDLAARADDYLTEGFGH